MLFVCACDLRVVYFDAMFCCAIIQTSQTYDLSRSAGATGWCVISVKVCLDLGVEHENESTTSATEDVGEASLEESLATFLLGNLFNAVHGAGVLNVSTSTAGLHHQPTTDGIKGVRDNTGEVSNNLGECENCEGVSSLHVSEHHGLTSVEATEVRGTVSNDTNDGDTETL